MPLTKEGAANHSWVHLCREHGGVINTSRKIRGWADLRTGKAAPSSATHASSAVCRRGALLGGKYVHESTMRRSTHTYVENVER
jgi:hypothetical protein